LPASVVFTRAVWHPCRVLAMCVGRGPGVVLDRPEIVRMGSISRLDQEPIAFPLPMTERSKSRSKRRARPAAILPATRGRESGAGETELCWAGVVLRERGHVARERGPPCPLRWESNQRQSLAWTQQQRHGRARLRPSRSAGLACSNTEPMGREQPWISPAPRPAGHPPEQTIRLGPETGWRGGGPPCPLRWAFVRRQPLEWTKK